MASRSSDHRSRLKPSNARVRHGARKKRIRVAVAASGTSLCDIRGIGPIGAAIILGAVGDIARFPTAGHFASYNATAPIEASSGDKRRHRLNRRDRKSVV